MPCGCFGKKNAQKGAKNASKEAPSQDTQGIGGPQGPPPPPESNGKSDDDPVKTAKRRDVVASYYGDQCALLGYRPTGSRPPSCVDSPSTPSRTPSTAPLASSPSPPLSSSPMSDSPSSTRRGASCRAELADKRREFFRDFIPEDELYSHRDYVSSTNSTTLPTVARARHFGEVRTVRPVSQPPASCSPTPLAPPPPGPHLLRPTPPTSKIDAFHEDDTVGFSSASFLRELRQASDEMSRRWGMALEEDGTAQQDGLHSPSHVPTAAAAPGDHHQVDPFAPVHEGCQPPTLTTLTSTTTISSNLVNDKAEYSYTDVAGSNLSSSPTHSSEHGQDDGQRQDQEDTVQLLEDSCLSSQVDDKAYSAREVKESSPLLGHEGETPAPVIHTTESEGEISQSDLVLIDGEKVYVETVDPDSVYFYEDRDLDHQASTPRGPPYGVATSEELQPILETDSDQESEGDIFISEDSRTVPAQEPDLVPVNQDSGSLFKTESHPATLEGKGGGAKAPADPILRRDCKESDFEYDKPAKISKTEADETELLLRDEELRIIRQSSSDVD